MKNKDETMQLGDKIKKARKALGLTQEALAKDVITRNMLSKIENNVATPSYKTLEYLSGELNLPIAYLYDDNLTLHDFEKKEVISEIYTAYSLNKYQSCINRIKRLSNIDNELAYILTECYFKEGVARLKRGALDSAEKYLRECELTAQKTLLSTSHLTVKMPMYLAICKNVSSPLLEFEPSTVGENMLNSIEFEYLKYISLDLEYSYKSPALQAHINAKREIKARNFYAAIKQLDLALEKARSNEYDAYTVFSIYSDYELCYKQISDFEKAYSYASKKLSLIEGFKS